MKIFDIKFFEKGWFIGNFKPSLFSTEDFEIAHHFHKKGFVGEQHYHTESTEYNYIVTGKAYVNGEIISSGHGWIYEEREISDVIFLEDTNLIIIRCPSVNDKVICK